MLPIKTTKIFAYIYRIDTSQVIAYKAEKNNAKEVCIMSKVAIASTDGITINEHFGRTEEFWIYESDEIGTYQFIERRKNALTEPKDHHVTTVQLLADVEVVLVNKIGPGAESQLRREGIIALSVSGSIEKALNSYAKRGKFIRNNALLLLVSLFFCGV